MNTLVTVGPNCKYESYDLLFNRIGRCNDPFRGKLPLSQKLLKVVYHHLPFSSVYVGENLRFWTVIGDPDPYFQYATRW